MYILLKKAELKKKKKEVRKSSRSKPIRIFFHEDESVSGLGEGWRDGRTFTLPQKVALAFLPTPPPPHHPAVLASSMYSDTQYSEQ